MAADLHVHSTYSDGSLYPEELAARAVEQGLNTIALADHDTVEGLDEALAAGNERGLEVVPAIEFSAFQGRAEIHILGYYLDYRAPQLLTEIENIFQSRLERAEKMVSKLNQLGIGISYQAVTELAGDKYIGRPHIARAMQQAGYIDEMGEAFTERYIGNQGQAYVPKFKLSPCQAIELIKKADGIPVLAHPYFINHGQPLERGDIASLKDCGLAGVEVYHSKQSPVVSEHYLAIAGELGLLVTGGSDFHGENSPGIELGDVRIGDDLVDRLRKAKERLDRAVD